MIVNSAQDLAHGLNQHLRLGLTPRPSNLYAPADTFWWQVASTAWPAYRHAPLPWGHDAQRHHVCLGPTPVQVAISPAG